MGSAERMRGAARLVAGCPGTPVVVVSAVAGVTDRLEALRTLAEKGNEEGWRGELEAIRALHLEILADLTGEGSDASEAGARIEEQVGEIRTRLERVQDDPGEGSGGPWETVGHQVAALGEDLSTILLETALRQEGVGALRIDAREVVRTDWQNGRGIPRDEETYRRARAALTPLVEAGTVPVLQGYIGATEDGRTTTLGRGGSDFTAAMVGAALGAPEVTIWTDVDGIHTSDPRIVPGARLLPELGFEEAVELAYFGARVIHPAAAKHAAARNVSLRIRNSFAPDREGTLIRADRREGPSVAAIAHRGGVVLIKVRSRPLFMAHGFLARVFEVLSRHHVPVDLVATSHTSTGFTLDREEELDAVVGDLQELAEVTVRRGMATVTVVGSGLLGRPGTTGRIFRVLEDRSVHLISQASDMSVSFLVDEDEAPEAVRRLHEELIEQGGWE